MKFMIIDGNSLVNRAFYGVRPLSTKEGIHTNAIFGPKRRHPLLPLRFPWRHE